ALTLSSSLSGLPIHPIQNSPSSVSGPSTSLLATGLPQGVGASPLPNLHLPQTVVSNVDSLIGAGGVIQTSSQNVTLQSLGLVLKLLGGPLPHDELSENRMAQSSWTFWSIQTNASGVWIPLHPVSNSINVLGSNSSGNFVMRTMGIGYLRYNGTLRILYEVKRPGELKWDLQFAPNTPGQYRLVFAWRNLTNSQTLSEDLKRFQIDYGNIRYTFSWA